MRKRKSIKGKLLIECDKLFRQIMLKSRPHCCEWCGRKSNKLQVAHILPKGLYPRLRYVPENILLLSFPCHPRKWHNNPLEATKFIKKYKGEDYYDKLKVINLSAPKMTLTYLNFLKEAFKKYLCEKVK